MRYLPPLNALRAFHAVTRTKSFSAAAEDMHVTHGAVSRHVKQLEDILGVQLFNRLPRGVELTDEGRELSFATQEAFEIISDATEKFQHRAHSKEVVISTVPSIAARWLVPRMEQFLKDNPNIELKISTTMRLIDPRKDRVDIVIRYGRGTWDDFDVEPLFCKNLTAVCSPALADRFEPELCLECLETTRLLISDGYRYWEAFLKAAGIKNLKKLSIVEFDDSNVAIQAAVAGQGIALLPEILVEDDIRKGRLVRPFAEAIPTDFGYYLGTPKGARVGAEAQKVVEWIKREAGLESANLDYTLMPEMNVALP